MNPEDRHRAEDLFHAARALPAGERAAFLDARCGGEAWLRREVESLLAHAESTSFLEDGSPLRASVRRTGPLEPPSEEAFPVEGRRIGSFRTLGVLGSGGMGVVYRAEQEHPRRVVALKLIRPGLVSVSLLRRFEHEVRLLGRLQHPGIAQVYEAGTFDTGEGPQPYFAMELVEGEPLTEYARRRGLGPRQRLGLLVKVCEAVQHAHQKSIVHRDLKPGNILVDATGQPKILDFGVARATDADVQLTTMHTDAGQLVGTLAYMSPEQVGGDPEELDTRSDIYALGVIGYELLVGRLPHDMGQKPIAEALRLIATESPAPLGSIDPTLRGDVETIVSKAMEKDRGRRYATALELAADIEHYLGNRPILARPPSAAYQFRKLVARHRALAASVATILLLVSGFGAWMAVLYGEAERLRIKAEAQRTAAVTARKEAEATAGFLGEMLASADPVEAGGRDMTVLQVLDRASERIEQTLAGQPLLEAALRSTIGKAYVSLGRYPAAERHLRTALEIRKRELGDEHLQVAAGLDDLGELFRDMGNLSAAETARRQALALRRKLLGREHWLVAESLNNLALVLENKGDNDGAEPLLREAVAMSRRLRGGDDIGVAKVLKNLATLLESKGDYHAAEAIHREALGVHRKLLGKEHPDLAVSLTGLGVVLIRLGRYAEAEPLLREALAIDRKALGDHHPRVGTILNNFGGLLLEKGDPTGAEAAFQEALGVFSRSLPADHWSIGSTRSHRGECLFRLGRYREAERELLQAHRILSAALGPEHARTNKAVQRLVSLYEAWGKPEEATRYKALLPRGS